MPPDLAALGGSAAVHLPGYFGMVKRLDEALGRLLDALKSLRLRENTIVLFTSDHGNHFKTRNSEYKRSCHESCIRVPTALCGPGFEGGGRVQIPRQPGRPAAHAARCRRAGRARGDAGALGAAAAVRR